MKTKLMRLILFCGLSLGGHYSRAQTNDTLQIKEAAINYVEGYYSADVDRVTKALSPELVKRIIVKDQAGDGIQTMGFSFFVFNTRKNKNQKMSDSGAPFHADVIIYDIGNNIAAAKVVTNKFKFIDYLQLGRMNGEWKIINVLWEYTSK